ncbi:MAG: hypothetical protein ACUVRS_11675 [Armatimonadota bacterium]
MVYTYASLNEGVSAYAIAGVDSEASPTTDRATFDETRVGESIPRDEAPSARGEVPWP